jgi:predicted dehydrogenase
MQKKIRWGIVGAGRISQSFVKDIAFVSNAELIAVAARNLESAQAFATTFNISKAYGSYAELFADVDVDAIYIATPHNLHFEHAIAAIKAGKHILCEKPVTVCSDECRQLIDAAKEQGVFFMEAMWTYFLPAIRKAQEWVNAGRIGKIRHVKADFGYPIPYAVDRREYDANLAGGCLLEMGIYTLAITDLFIKAESTYCYSSVKFAPNGVENDVISVISYNDAIATLASSFSAKLQNWAYIIGENGYIAIPDFWRAHNCYLYQLDQQVDTYDDGRVGLGFNYQIESVSNDILAGKLESITVSHAASLSFQERMEMIKETWIHHT